MNNSKKKLFETSLALYIYHTCLNLVVIVAQDSDYLIHTI